MKISKQAQRDARQLFRSCHVNNLLDENRVRQAIKLLSGQKPRGYVEILSRLALIGGIRIQIGSDLYDGSIKMRLEKLEQSF